jgi:hypothetical protein
MWLARGAMDLKRLKTTALTFGIDERNPRSIRECKLEINIKVFGVSASVDQRC